MKRAWTRKAIVIGAAVLTASGCATIDRVNTSSSGVEANAATGGVTTAVPMAVSGTGRYVAFDSKATNLVTNVTDGLSHVYRKDRKTGFTIAVDRDSNGVLSTKPSFVAAISDDAHSVAFITDAALTSNDLNQRSDLYVRDITAGTTVLISIMPDGSQIPGGTGAGVFTAKFDALGRVLFEVGAGTLPPRNRLELRDLAAGTTTEVLGNSQVTDIFFSYNGEHVVYNTGCFQVGGCSPSPGLIDLLHPYPFSLPACSGSTVAGLSDDGRYVAYRRSSNGVGCSSAVGRFDRQTGTWMDFGLPFATSTVTGISGDGRFVALVADDTLLPGGTFGFRGFFGRDLVTGWTGRLTAGAFDGAANATEAATDTSALSRDGRTLVFTSAASNLVVGDGNGLRDVFGRALPRPSITGITPTAVARGATATITVTGDEFVAGVTAVFAGAGVTVNTLTRSASGHTLTLSVSVAPGAAIGARDLTVTNVGGFGEVQALCPHCLTVT